MCQLLETIKILNGKISNINYHNLRFNKSRKEIFNANDFIDLSKIIKITDYKNPIKCRIIYSAQINKITYQIYKKRKISNLKIMFNNEIEYNYKYLNRTELDNLFSQKNNCDDILIVKNKLITDTSFSNIIFFDGKNLLTPAKPLLKGTKRQALLDQGLIREEEIYYKDIKKFKYAQLINSMLDLVDDVIININNIMDGSKNPILY